MVRNMYLGYLEVFLSQMLHYKSLRTCSAALLCVEIDSEHDTYLFLASNTGNIIAIRLGVPCEPSHFLMSPSANFEEGPDKVLECEHAHYLYP